MSVVKVTRENFAEVKKESRPVLLDFYADWCGPCQMMAPVVAEMAEECPEYFIGKINVDTEPELAAAFSVESIPMFLVLKNGEITAHAVGYREKEALMAMLEL